MDLMENCDIVLKFHKLFFEIVGCTFSNLAYLLWGNIMETWMMLVMTKNLSCLHSILGKHFHDVDDIDTCR